MSDACPHRLAPLSQGRIDPLSGCIECPYHGQQFDTAGTCTLIPQLEKGSKIPLANNAHSLAVHSTGDLLWAFVPLPEGKVASSYTALPDEVFPALLESSSFTVRELPYSFDFLIENFLDPAHIPFAHHSLQAVRADGQPIPMQPLTAVENATHCEIGYQDSIRGKSRDGVVSFIAPCFYHFRVRDPLTGLFKISLVAVVAPIEPGKCRIFLDLPGLRKIGQRFPKWLLHSFTNRFLDSDVWIHDQERVQRGVRNGGYLGDSKESSRGSSSSTGGDSSDSSDISDSDVSSSSDVAGRRYVMPTQSDTGTRVWRQWWRRHMKDSPVFGEPQQPLKWLSHDEQVGRWWAVAVGYRL